MANWTAQEAFSWGMYSDNQKLASALRGEAPYNSYHRTMDSVRRDLRNAIARGSVKARGFKVDCDKPPLTREFLPAESFDLYPAFAVDVSGETMFILPSSPQNLPKWKKIVFNEGEVRALWPRPTPELDRWMLDDVLNHPDKKLNSRIGDCRKANNCTHREALEANKRLPQDMRRGRGQRIKKNA